MREESEKLGQKLYYCLDWGGEQEDKGKAGFLGKKDKGIKRLTRCKDKVKRQFGLQIKMGDKREEKTDHIYMSLCIFRHEHLSIRGSDFRCCYLFISVLCALVCVWGCVTGSGLLRTYLPAPEVRDKWQVGSKHKMEFL